MIRDGQQESIASQVPISSGLEQASRVSPEVEYHGTAADPNPRWVGDRLDKLWIELADEQLKCAGFNSDIVAKHLHQAELALRNNNPALAKVRLLSAEYWLVQARHSAEHSNLGPWIAISIELAYIVGGLVLMFAFGHLTASVWFGLPGVGNMPV